MVAMKMIFFSDTHLTKGNTGKRSSVEGFIRDVCAHADMVFILGDLFEFYHGYHGYIYPWYASTVEALRVLTRQGKSVYLIEGNHEFDMGPFFESYTGIKCTRDLTMDIEGKRTFIAHGDRLRNNYFLRLLKSKYVYSFMNAIGPILSWRLAMGMSLLLSKKKKGYNRRVMNRFRLYARTKLEEGYDVVILAHSHMSDMVAFGSGADEKIYLNTGDLARCSAYAEYATGEGFSIKTYKPH
jgi:UDP-2,3-diacylglucosamine hydrolase